MMNLEPVAASKRLCMQRANKIGKVEVLLGKPGF